MSAAARYLPGALLAALLSWADPGALAQTAVVYSHADAAQARRAYALARAFEAEVWMDKDIRPGTAWRPAAFRALCGAKVVLVLWSASASTSAEVGRELAQAAACGVLLVPVVLDATPLPAGLAEVHWVDWR